MNVLHHKHFLFIPSSPCLYSPTLLHYSFLMSTIVFLQRIQLIEGGHQTEEGGGGGDGALLTRTIGPKWLT